MFTAWKKRSCLMRMFQAKVEKGNTSLRSCFSSHTPCKHHFQGAFNAIISICFCLFVHKILPTHSEISQRWLQWTLWKKIFVSILHSSVSEHCAGHKFHANELRTYNINIFKQKCIKQSYRSTFGEK